MKHIEKQTAPARFIEWKSGDWSPNWDDLSGNSKVREILKDSLLQEQGYICCYCEKSLLDKNGNVDGHFEHVLPRSYKTENGETVGRDQELDYTNIVFSCQKETLKEEPRTCGRSKKDWYDPVRFISPLMPDCEGRFVYRPDGEIISKENNDPSTTETISRLNLNEHRLKRSREEAIDEIFAALEEKDFSDFVQKELSKNAKGMFRPFWSMKKQFFELLLKE